MSWSRRRLAAALLGAALVTSGCFRPMLAEQSTSSDLLGQIAFPEVTGRFGYHLNETLTDRLGRPSAPAYRLEVAAALTEQGLAIAQDNTVTRIRLVAAADWALYRNGETEPVMSAKTVSQSGYDATASLFATRQTRKDIERRLARDIGERIARGILARAGRITGTNP